MQITKFKQIKLSIKNGVSEFRWSKTYLLLTKINYLLAIEVFLLCIFTVTVQLLIKAFLTMQCMHRIGKKVLINCTVTYFVNICILTKLQLQVNNCSFSAINMFCSTY